MMQYFSEDLGNGVNLVMAEIPGGNFIMGSPEGEEGTTDSERPQHQVTIQPFYMGKYPITQFQWQSVANLPQVNRKLEPNPSRFKGGNRPVEYVSWEDAAEFCARLTSLTKRDYSLPSEAQWEYACRSGTKTPFYFGETITTDLVNYDGEFVSNYDGEPVYGDEPKGIYREETTEVGIFPPNAFGLYDMHGNVLEWCQDEWHDTYKGAPTDGSAWLGNGDKRVLRGGSWFDSAADCRSAKRIHPGSWYVSPFDFIGFRVAKFSGSSEGGIKKRLKKSPKSEECAVYYGNSLKSLLNKAYDYFHVCLLSLIIICSPQTISLYGKMERSPPHYLLKMNALNN